MSSHLFIKTAASVSTVDSQPTVHTLWHALSQSYALHNMSRASVPRSLILPCSAEVNASPSLSTDTTADYQLKWGLVEDALGLVDVEGKLEGQLPLSFGG